MSLFRRKPKPEIDLDKQYWVTTFGPMVVEQVQMPQSYTDLDKQTYEAVMWIVQYKIKGGPVFFERSYIKAEHETLVKFNTYLRYDEVVLSDYDALYRFYRALHSEYFNGRLDGIR